MHSIDMLVPPTDNKEVEEVEKNNVDFSDISATFKEVVENQKEVNEQLANSINEVVNKLTSTEKKESEVIENEWRNSNLFNS